MADELRDRVRRARGGIPQHAFAVQAGINPSTLARIEQGKVTNVETATLAAIARAAGISVNDLLGAPNEAASTVALESDPVVEQVIAEEECTPEEAAALRSANWKLVAGANYGPDFIRRVLLARRRPAPAVETKLPATASRLQSRAKR